MGQQVSTWTLGREATLGLGFLSAHTGSVFPLAAVQTTPSLVAENSTHSLSYVL